MLKSFVPEMLLISCKDKNFTIHFETNMVRIRSILEFMLVIILTKVLRPRT